MRIEVGEKPAHSREATLRIALVRIAGHNSAGLGV